MIMGPRLWHAFLRRKHVAESTTPVAESMWQKAPRLWQERACLWQKAHHDQRPTTWLLYICMQAALLQEHSKLAGAFADVSCRR